MSAIRRPWLRTILLVLIVVFVGIQLVPVNRTNPSGGDPIQAAPEVMEILRRSCFDCHSHETRWPWYSRVAPVSWLLADHVEEGREHLNFSQWEALPAGTRNHLREEVWHEVEEGEMPLSTYLLLHAEAELSGGDKEILRQWSTAAESAPAVGQTRGQEKP